MRKLQYKITVYFIMVLLVIDIFCGQKGSRDVFAQEATSPVVKEQDGEQKNEYEPYESESDEDVQDGDAQVPEITISTIPELDNSGDFVPIITEAELEYIISADKPCDIVLHIEKKTLVMANGKVTTLMEELDKEISLTEDSLEYSLVFKEEGEYNVCAILKDTEGDDLEIEKTYFRIDKTAPFMNISGVENGAYYKEKQTIQFTVIDFTPDLEKTAVTLWRDGESQGIQELSWVAADKDGYQYKTQLTLEAEGSYEIIVEGSDQAGNRGESRRVSFWINWTGPVITADCDTDYTAWSNRDITFDTTVSDSKVGIKEITYKVKGKIVKKVTFDKPVSVYDYKLTVSDNADKVSGYPVIIEAVNSCGISATLRRRVYIDKEAPQIQLSGVENGVHYNTDSSITAVIEDVSYGGTKTIFVIQRTLDGETERMTVPSFQSKQYRDTCNRLLTREGTYTIYALATDGAGNITKSNTLSFVIDKTPPKLELSGADEGSMNGNPVVLNMFCEESFFITNEVSVQVEKSLDGKTITQELTGFPKKQKQSSMQHTFTEDGVYHVTISATDKAGNIAETQSLIFSIDRTKPEIRIYGTGNYELWNEPATVRFAVIESFYSDNVVNISGSRTDMHGAVTAIELPRLASTGKISTLSQTFEEDGIYAFKVVSKDKAGNESSGEIHFIIDQTAPQINRIKQFDGGHYQEFKLADTLEGFFEDLTVISYRILLNGLEYNGTDVVSEEGKYNLYIVAEDALGHTSSETAEFIIDRTAPKVIFAGVKNGEVVHEKGIVTLSLADAEDKITAVRMNGLDCGADVRSLSYTEYGTYQIDVDCVDLAGNKATRSLNFVYNSEETDTLRPGKMGLLLIPLCLGFWVRRRKRKGKCEKDDKGGCI